MANLNVTKGGGPIDAFDNQPSHGLQDYHDGRREYKPAAEHQDWRVVVAGGVVAGGALLLLWLLWSIWKSLYCWQSVNWSRCDAINAAEPGAVALVLLLVASSAVAWAVVRLATAWRLGRSRAARTATTYNRWGNPVRVDLFTAPEFVPERYLADVALKERTAPHEALHSINTYSPAYQLPKDGAAAALPAPVEVAPLVAAETWLQWVNEQPHVILAAETGGGKSTTAKAILAPRIAGGEQVFVIDPHSDAWFDLPIAGGGENWPEVQAALSAVGDEYRRRIAERDAYLRQHGRALPTDHWTRLTVLLDEAFITRLKLDQGRRGEVTPWQQFAQVLGSGARKVRISILLLTQSANVEDLGLSGPMRENFLRIALDSAAARKLITAEEPNTERRKLLFAGLEGQQYPAVCEYRAQVHLLDRTGLDKVVAPAGAAQAAWRPQLDPAARPSEGLIEVLRQLRAGGWTREEARASGLSFDNDLWAEAGP